MIDATEKYLKVSYVMELLNTQHNNILDSTDLSHEAKHIVSRILISTMSRCSKGAEKDVRN